MKDRDEILRLMSMFRYKSEWIKEEDPDIIIQLDWEDLKNVHPYRQGDFILKFLQSHNIPATGEVDIEKVTKGRLYWDDCVDIGYRTFFYFKKEPVYLPCVNNKEYFICRLVCPICKELCGGVADHIEQTKDVLPEERQFHGCMYGHRWLVIKGKKIRYRPVDSLITSDASYELVENEDESITEIIIDRSVTFDE